MTFNLVALNMSYGQLKLNYYKKKKMFLNKLKRKYVQIKAFEN